MARPSGPRKLYRYTEEFKAEAVRMSLAPGVLVRDVAGALDVHPFLLSRWRRDAREGRLVTAPGKVDEKLLAELQELRRVKTAYDRLKEEHELLKKAIRFVSERRQRSSSSSKAVGKRTGSV